MVIGTTSHLIRLISCDHVICQFDARQEKFGKDEKTVACGFRLSGVFC